jgi:ribulose-phosphate 3-epimerase
MQIIPTILTGSLTHAQSQLTALQDFPQLETVHIDVIDGNFAPEVTITPVDLLTLQPGSLTVDFHLMTDEPLDDVYECINFKDELPINAIIGQVERMSYQKDFIKDVRGYGWQVGLSLDLHTPLESIDDESWSEINIIQLLAVEVGAQGQTLNQNIFPKLEELFQKLEADKLDIEVYVDGGIKLENIGKLADLGVDAAVVGSGLWAEDDTLSLAESLAALTQELA